MYHSSQYQMGDLKKFYSNMSSWQQDLSEIFNVVSGNIQGSGSLQNVNFYAAGSGTSWTLQGTVKKSCFWIFQAAIHPLTTGGDGSTIVYLDDKIITRSYYPSSYQYDYISILPPTLIYLPYGATLKITSFSKFYASGYYLLDF